MKKIEMRPLYDSRWAVTVDGIVRRVFHDEEECRRVKEKMTAEEEPAGVESHLSEAIRRNAARQEK